MIQNDGFLLKGELSGLDGKDDKRFGKIASMRRKENASIIGKWINLSDIIFIGCKVAVFEKNTA